MMSLLIVWHDFCVFIQPVLLQFKQVFFGSGKNSQHHFPTSFTAVLQNKLHIFVALFTATSGRLFFCYFSMRSVTAVFYVFAFTNIEWKSQTKTQPYDMPLIITVFTFCSFGNNFLLGVLCNSLQTFCSVLLFNTTNLSMTYNITCLH